MLAVHVSADELYAVQRTLNATNAQVDRAALRAVNKTIVWARSQGGRRLAREHDLPLKSLRPRMRLFKASPGDLRGTAWFGVRPIKAIYAGSPQRSGTGTKVRKHFFASGFVARMPSGHRGVFKRRGKSRLPIEEQTIPLRTASAILGDVARDAPARLRTVYAQEINYEVNVRGA